MHFKCPSFNGIYTKTFKYIISNGFKFLCVIVKRFPFDWHNPVGYVAAISSEVICGFYVICVILNQTSFFGGSCWMLVSLADDITCDLETLNKVDGNGLEFTEKFMNYIQLHSEAKELRTH